MADFAGKLSSFVIVPPQNGMMMDVPVLECAQEVGVFVISGQQRILMKVLLL